MWRVGYDYSGCRLILKLEAYNAFCGALPQSEYVVQWGGAHVWKVGGKLFAICWDDPDHIQVTFKASEIAYEVLKDQPGLRPAPYLASRGMKWIQHYRPPGLSDADLKVHVEASYHMAIKRLTRKKREALGLT